MVSLDYLPVSPKCLLFFPMGYLFFFDGLDVLSSCYRLCKPFSQSILTLCIINSFLSSHTVPRSVSGMEMRAQKEEVRLGELARWERESPLSGEMASCGNGGVSTRAPGIRTCLDIRTGPLAPASFLQLPWTMLLAHQTVPRPPNLEEQGWCPGTRRGCL